MIEEIRSEWGKRLISQFVQEGVELRGGGGGSGEHRSPKSRPWCLTCDSHEEKGLRTTTPFSPEISAALQSKRKSPLYLEYGGGTGERPPMRPVETSD